MAHSHQATGNTWRPINRWADKAKVLSQGPFFLRISISHLLWPYVLKITLCHLQMSQDKAIYNRPIFR